MDLFKIAAKVAAEKSPEIPKVKRVLDVDEAEKLFPGCTSPDIMSDIEERLNDNGELLLLEDGRLALRNNESVHYDWFIWSTSKKRYVEIIEEPRSRK